MNSPMALFMMAIGRTTACTEKGFIKIPTINAGKANSSTESTKPNNKFN